MGEGHPAWEVPGPQCRESLLSSLYPGGLVAPVTAETEGTFSFLLLVGVQHQDSDKAQVTSVQLGCPLASYQSGTQAGTHQVPAIVHPEQLVADPKALGVRLQVAAPNT